MEGKPGIARTARLRGETTDEVLDRNTAELLQELRVTITGVQVLFGFLLTLPFSSRFGDLDAFATVLYVLTLMATATSAALLIAPVSYHRVVFRRRARAALVRDANRLLRAGLALLLLALVSAVLLVLDVVLGVAAALTGGAFVAAVGLGTWYLLPRRALGSRG
ncbi:hypothetical protein SAMN03159343_1549 [Klenkia marina]|uniref:Sodium:proton antiporter n=1 Tax=Klenkia marina TaxID=1960309 RepID=A0A1G4XVJ9_9ACTN|nr:DUF6328 family protein [Klenkia marina]SCX45234.1 hypothetical protein SAMN03159343_1549 [Klenkia marina]